MPINILFGFFISLRTRPVTAPLLLFTWLIPLLPLCFAWDGAVSNARTYTLDDLDELLADVESENYEWDKGTLEGKSGRRIYLMGWPT